MPTNSISIKEAADVLGCSQQYLRICLQEKLFDFGNAVRMSNKKWTYYVNHERLNAYIMVGGTYNPDSLKEGQANEAEI